MRLSIFICTYNPNHEFLRRTVDAIFQQDLDKDYWDFNIIDNNSKLPVSEIPFIKERQISVISEKTPGLTAARKCAAKAATGDVIVFVDDDNILEPNYLSAVLDIFNTHKELGIVSGNIFPEYLAEPEKWFYNFEEMIAIRRHPFPDLIINDKNVFNNAFPIGAGMSVRKKLIDDYFESHLSEKNKIEGRKGSELSSGEDIDLDFYALSAGYKIGVSPRLRMVHIIPAVRVTVEYIVKLTKSSTKSAYLVNRKWRPVFGHNVFEAFDFSYTTLAIKLAKYKLASFKNNYKVHFATHFVILKHKLKDS